jgi:N-acetylglutamate synthase-like GNAT family acetyltransferase
MAILYEIRAATEEETRTARACLTRHVIEVGGIAARSSDTAGTMCDDDKPFSVLAISQNQVVGGLIGKVFFNWLDAELVWVEKAFRGSGVGKNLLQTAERTGRDRGLTGIYLWTESWQAPDFYRKRGFEQFAEFDNFPPGHKRLGFRKYF